MPGQTDLQTVLDSMQIALDEVAYGFAMVAEDASPASKGILATFREDEGLTIIAPVAYLEKHRIKHEGPFAKLTVEVHTSLELVGLTAALTTKLTKHGISANVVAAYYHDHIFVPYNMRAQAVHALGELHGENND
jgi:hypothetical protein